MSESAYIRHNRRTRTWSVYATIPVHGIPKRRVIAKVRHKAEAEAIRDQANNGTINTTKYPLSPEKGAEEPLLPRLQGKTLITKNVKNLIANNTRSREVFKELRKLYDGPAKPHYKTDDPST